MQFFDVEAGTIPFARYESTAESTQINCKEHRRVCHGASLGRPRHAANTRSLGSKCAKVTENYYLGKISLPMISVKLRKSGDSPSRPNVP